MVKIVPALLACLALPLDVTESSAPAAQSALTALKSLDYRYFVAGGTCAAISHGITTPIDVVKTRIQADPEKYAGGMRQATAQIIKTDGAQALLGGLGPTVVGYGIEGAMKFGVYEVMKPVFSALLSRDGGSNALAFLLASVVAGAVAALLLCPMESTRIKIVTDEDYADKNLLTALSKLTAEEGFGSTFAGLWAMLAKQVPYTFGKQVSFDVFARMLYATYHRLNISLGGAQVKFLVSVISAFLASLIACIFSQPGDMILTETYRPAEKMSQIKTAMAGQEQPAAPEPQPTETMEAQGQQGEAATVLHEPQFQNLENQVLQGQRTVQEDGTNTVTAVAPASNNDSRKFVDVINRLYADGGIPKFFTGTQARILHVGLIITSQLVIYDIVKQLLGLPATGSH